LYVVEHASAAALTCSKSLSSVASSTFKISAGTGVRPPWRRSA
jgi:hypothetical protein